MIETKTAKIYYSPAARRRFFTLKAAVNAEAKHIILKRYPPEPYEEDTGSGYDIRYNGSESYCKMHSKLSFIIKKSFTNNQRGA